MASELREAAIVPMQDGNVGGLNGLFAALAHERDLAALCLLGELPYFATNVPNPKASLAVLRAFARLSGIALDLEELQSAASDMERRLVAHLETVERAQAARREAEEETADLPAADESGDGEPSLAPDVSRRIEELFGQAANDRAKALELKSVLDRHGVFERYEDRFLDLFKHGG
jgi:hypothetical protein